MMGAGAMPTFTREQYSRSQTEDLETAIASAVMRLLQCPFPGPGGRGTIKLAETFPDHATMYDEFVSPAAAVEPEGSLEYGPSHPVPMLDDTTWEPQDKDGKPLGEAGFGLYVLSEASRTFDVTVRSYNQAERNALKAGVETAFVDPKVLRNPLFGARYGVLVAQMPEYWNLPCRLTLLSSEKDDNPDRAAKNQWQAHFRISAQARHVKLAEVVPFRVKIRALEVGDT